MQSGIKVISRTLSLNIFAWPKSSFDTQERLYISLKSKFLPFLFFKLTETLIRRLKETAKLTRIVSWFFKGVIVLAWWCVLIFSVFVHRLYPWLKLLWIALSTEILSHLSLFLISILSIWCKFDRWANQASWSLYFVYALIIPD